MEKGNETLLCCVVLKHMNNKGYYPFSDWCSGSVCGNDVDRKHIFCCVETGQSDGADSGPSTICSI